VSKLKWLYPGMRVKRWVVLLLLGVLAIDTGTVVMLNSPVFSLWERKILAWAAEWPVNPVVSGVVLILLGLVGVALGVRNVVSSVVEAVRPSAAPDLVEHVYKTRNLQKGLHIVGIGGGTGLSTMLRGLKEYTSNITAVVTVADDGGSSGRIRDDLGILPPGDIRNTLVALADTEPLMETLFQYRFSWGEGLAGHSFGNLFIAAMTDITGDFEEGIRAFSKVLAVRGKVLPSTLESVRLGAIYTDGSTVLGESCIPEQGKKIKRVFLEPKTAQALPEALEAIRHADVVVLGPGSLYTSIIPNLLVEGLAQAIAETQALRIYVCNVMTQPGETDGYSASDHVKALLAHLGPPSVLDYVLVNKAAVSSGQAKKYAAQGAYPVRADTAAIERLGIKVHTADVLDQQDLVRHSSLRLAEEIIRLAEGRDKAKTPAGRAV